MREVLTGYRRGSEALALPEYAPGMPRLSRYQAKAGELGVSAVTVRLDLTALGRQEEWEEPAGRSESARSATPDFAS